MIKLSEGSIQTDSANSEDEITGEFPALQRKTVDHCLVAAVELGPSTIFIDFDYTLFASNSTELFIGSCKPSLLVAVIEFIVRRCLPWRLIRLPNWFRIRDYVCCLAIIALCPGSIARWRRLAPAFFKQYVSPELGDVLRQVAVGRVVIISFGMKFIVEALLQDSIWSSVPLIATPTITGLSHFKYGKRVLATRYASGEVVAASVFITDSLDDSDLLIAAKVGILIPPQGIPLNAIERLYLPLRYTAIAKYTRSYAIDQFVLVEFLLLIISCSQNFEQILNNSLFIAFLFTSIICIYEVGYFENDMKSARHEKFPVLKDAVSRFQLYPIIPGAWIWAIAAGSLGNLLACVALHAPYSELFVRVPAWIAGLIVLRLVFQVYNKPNLRARLHLYPVLQLLKFLAILIVAPATPIGAVIIFAQIATMSAIYITYRHGGRAKEIERELLRVILIVIGLLLLLITTAGRSMDWRFQLIATGVWMGARLGKTTVLSLIRPYRKG